MNTLRVLVGDWICFQHGGRLVIDSVVYFKYRASWDSTLVAVTVGHGVVEVQDVLEVRQPVPPSPEAPK